MGRGRRDRRERDRGVVAVLSVSFVVMLLAFLTLIINVGRLMRTKGDLQHAADSAALAAMEILDNKATGAAFSGRLDTDYDSSIASMRNVALKVGQLYKMTTGAGP